MYAYLFKANPYRDSEGRFTTRDNVGRAAFHGTSVADLIESEGFKIVPTKNGRLLGDGIYLSTNRHTSEQYAKDVGGRVLEVSLDGLKVKEFKKSMDYTKFLMKSGDTDLTPASMTLTMKKLGFDAVSVADNFVVFSPEKLKIVVDAVTKAATKWYIVVSASKPKG